jgi:hypothetical protein
MQQVAEDLHLYSRGMRFDSCLLSARFLVVFPKLSTWATGLELLQDTSPECYLITVYDRVYKLQQHTRITEPVQTPADEERRNEPSASSAVIIRFPNDAVSATKII